MRLRDRLLLVFVGLLLIILSAWLVLQGVFAINLIDYIKPVFVYVNPKWIIIAIAVIGLIVAFFTLRIALRKTHKQKDFVFQKIDHGELSISLKTIDGLIRKSVNTHEEIVLKHVLIDVVRDTVAITLRIAVADNISIPLAVSAVEKQLKQYITTSTGIQVSNVHVLVQDSDENAASGSFKLHEACNECIAPECTETVQPVKETVKELVDEIPSECSEVEDVDEVKTELNDVNDREQPELTDYKTLEETPSIEESQLEEKKLDISQTYEEKAIENRE